jgi:hypothetical protein
VETVIENFKNTKAFEFVHKTPETCWTRVQLDPLVLDKDMLIKELEKKLEDSKEIQRNLAEAQKGKKKVVYGN